MVLTFGFTNFFHTTDLVSFCYVFCFTLYGYFISEKNKNSLKTKCNKSCDKTILNIHKNVKLLKNAQALVVSYGKIGKKMNTPIWL